eukprot:8269926-Lingulodinium_polyedra.AAC.1
MHGLAEGQRMGPPHGQRRHPWPEARERGDRPAADLGDPQPPGLDGRQAEEMPQLLRQLHVVEGVRDVGGRNPQLLVCLELNGGEGAACGQVHLLRLGEPA